MKFGVGLCAAVLLGVAGCAGVTGRYAGVANVRQGLCSAQAKAGDTIPATLMLDGEEAQFVPGDGIVVLRGRVDAAGHVKASAVGTGGEASRFTQVFEGDLKDGKVTGQYASPRCRADVSLARR